MAKGTIRTVLLVTAILAVPVAPGLRAQQEGGSDGEAGFLERQLQNILGGEGRDVRVIGLQGVLSSEASIERIEIADADGTWLVVRDVVLDWNRLALLRRRLEVEALTVAGVEVLRKPLPGPAEPPALAAEAEPRQPFALPELPVSVQVEQLSLGGLVLREPVIGQPLAVSINGNARLANGEGGAELAVVRIDGQEGRITLDAGFDNATRVLGIDLAVVEAEGGLIATLARMPGAPSLELTVQGEAPISDFAAEIDLRTDGVDRLDGTVGLAEAPGPEGSDTPARLVTAQITGDVAELFLPDYRDFFGRALSLDLAARQHPDTGLDIDTLRLDTQGLQLAGTASLDAAFLPERIDLTGRIGNPLGLPVILPVPGPQLLVHGADLALDYDVAEGDDLTLSVVADGVMRGDGLLVDRVALDFDGALAQDGAALESLSGTLTAAVEGFTSTDEALSLALSDSADLGAAIAWENGGPLAITDLLARSGEDARVTGAATVTGLQTGLIAVAGDVAAELGDLTRFSMLAGRDLSGALAADLDASYDLSTGAFDVDLDGRGTDLAIGDDNADDLLAGDSRVGLTAARTTGGIAVDRLEVETRTVALDGRARIAPDGFPRLVDLSGRVADPEGAPVRLPLPGPVTELQSADLAIRYDAEAGEAFTAQVAADGLTRADGIAIGQTRLAADGTLTRGEGLVPQAVDARVSASIAEASATDAGLDAVLAEGLTLDADLVADIAAGTANLTGLEARSGELVVSGAAEASGLTGEAPLASGTLRLDSGPLARFAALTGQDLTGRVAADLTARYALATGFFDVELDGNTTDLALGQPDIDPLLAGRAELRVTAARDAEGISVPTLRLTSPIADIDGSVDLDPEFWPRRAVLAGRIAEADGSPLPLPVPGPVSALGSADIDVNYDAAAGDAFTARVRLSDATGAGGLRIGRTELSAEGRLARDGTAIEQLVAAIRAEVADATADDPALRAAVGPGALLTADLDALPGAGTASLRNLSVRAGELTASGRADVTGLDTGTPAAAAAFDIDTGDLGRFAPLVGRPLSGRLTASAEAAADTGAGRYEIDLSADGTNLGVGIAEVDRLIGGASRVRLQAAQGADGLELPVLEVTTPELTVSGSGGMDSGSGTIDVSARLRDLGVVVPAISGPVTLDGQARNTGEVWAVTADVGGPAGTTMRVTGDALRPDGTVELRATGSLPLALASRILAPRTIEGGLDFSLAVSGPPALESVSGEVRVSNARIADPATRIALENLGATVALSGGRANLDVAGDLASGGRLRVSGPVTLSGDFPADIRVVMDRMVFVDPRIYEVLVNGEIDVTGPLLGGALIAGDILIDRAEIKIPSGLGGASSIPDITHVAETAQSRLTRRRAGLLDDGNGGSGSGGGGGPVYGLDITISAPREIFVRGRGLDAELGGEIRIGGTTANIQPSGELSLIRGTLNLLARRLNFTEATVSLQGDLVPDLRLVASSTNDSITAQIVIEGPVTAPEINFTSQPELPEDEVLAQLFFDKPISELTPLEVAQLASAVRELTGRGGGLFGRIREGLGVDELSVQSDAEGNTSVTAGRYISERIYSDVTVNAEGTTEIELNYEIRRDFNVTGGFDSEGNSAIGFTFERDY